MKDTKRTYRDVVKSVPKGVRRDYIKLMIKSDKYTPEYLWMFAYEAFERRNTGSAVDIMNEMVERNPERFGKEIYITKEEIEGYWKRLGL